VRLPQVSETLLVKLSTPTNEGGALSDGREYSEKTVEAVPLGKKDCAHVVELTT